MRRKFKTGIGKRVSAVMRGNDGASIVLVTIISILIITGVIILRTTTSALWASADKQLNQDQAYELAASLGESIDILIERGDYNIQNETSGKEIYSSVTNDDKFTGLPDAKVVAKVTDIAGGKKLTVTANVGKAEYVYVKDYRV